MLLAASAVLGFVSMERSREAISEIMQQRMMDIANCAASVDGDILEPLTAEDEGSKDYQTVFDALALYRDAVAIQSECDTLNSSIENLSAISQKNNEADAGK